MSKTTSSRNFLSISDVHLGNGNTATGFILKNLMDFLGIEERKLRFPELKVIFIAGDLWDKSVHLGADFIPEFMIFWFKFCHWCIRHNVRVRLLKGTPRHDANQGATISSITKASFADLDFKYYPELCIDREDDLDLNILYVPDECRTSADVVYQDVLSLLHDRNLTQVDLGVMHGMFKYQLGTIPMNHKVHLEEPYLNIVKGPIVIGHIHKTSCYERIYAQGSFDRLAHNEEGAKGAFFFKEDKPGKWIPLFLENTEAKLYKSLEISNDAKKAAKEIHQLANSLPDDSRLRIVLSEGHDLLKGFDEITKAYPFLKFSLKIVSEQKQKLYENVEDYHALVLNKDTLADSIVNEINQAGPLLPHEEVKLRSLLQSLHR